jgi:hypothetical protein
MTIPTTTDRAMGAALIDIIRKDVQRKSRRKKIGRFLQLLAQAILTDCLASLMAGLWLMLVVGIVHGEWIRSCPTLGYWWAVLLSLLLRSALAGRSSQKKSDGPS